MLNWEEDVKVEIKDRMMKILDAMPNVFYDKLEKESEEYRKGFIACYDHIKYFYSRQESYNMHIELSYAQAQLDNISRLYTVVQIKNEAISREIGELKHKLSLAENAYKSTLMKKELNQEVLNEKTRELKKVKDENFKMLKRFSEVEKLQNIIDHQARYIEQLKNLKPIKVRNKSAREIAPAPVHKGDREKKIKEIVDNTDFTDSQKVNMLKTLFF